MWYLVQFTSFDMGSVVPNPAPLFCTYKKWQCFLFNVDKVVNREYFFIFNSFFNYEMQTDNYDKDSIDNILSHVNQTHTTVLMHSYYVSPQLGAS